MRFGSPWTGIETRKRIGTGLVLIGLLCLVWAFFTRGTVFNWDFRNNLWAPAYLLLQGQSPYRIQVLFDGSRAIWFPMAIGGLFPLGLLSLQQATNLWFMLSIGGLVALVWLASGTSRPPLLLFAIGMLTVVVFPPTIAHLRLGQFTIVTTLIFLAVALWGDRLPLMLVALVLALALTKPQLAVLVMPGILISRIRDCGVKNAILLLALLLLSVVALTVPLFLGYPAWFADFLWVLDQNPSWAHPSLFSVLTTLLGKPGLYVWAGMAAIVAASNVWIWLKLSKDVAILLSLALTPLATPYVWSWDFVMIMPLFVASLFRFRAKQAHWFLLTGYAICWGLTVAMNSGGDVSNYANWWLPWVLLGVIGTAAVIEKLFAGSRDR